MYLPSQPVRVAILLALCMTGLAFGADQIVRKNGEVLTGRIVLQEPDRVVLEVSRPGSLLQIPIMTSDIAEIRRDVPEEPAATQPATSPAEPGYYVLELLGTLGSDTTLPMVRQLIADARDQKAAVIVLTVDSSGGDIATARAILDELAKLGSVRIVTYVRNAHGAAAALAMAGNDIYFAPAGEMAGFADAPSADEPEADQLALRVQRRGLLLAAAELGGHPALIAEALADPSIALSIVEQDGDIVAAAGMGGKPLTAAGSPLILTASPAIEIGLVRKSVLDVDGAAQALGIPGLRRLKDRSNYVRGQEMARRKAAYDTWLLEQRKSALAARQQAYRQAIQPRIAEIDRQIALLDTDVRQNQARLQQVKDDYDRLEDRARRRYEDTVRLALDIPDDLTRARLISGARRWLRDTVDDLEADYENAAAPLRSAIDKAASDARGLLTERQELLNGLPTRLPPDWQPAEKYPGPLPQ